MHCIAMIDDDLEYDENYDYGDDCVTVVMINYEEWVPVEAGGDCVEPFLASCVPDLQLHHLIASQLDIGVLTKDIFSNF